MSHGRYVVGGWRKGAAGCAFEAARRRNVRRLAVADVPSETVKRAERWVARHNVTDEQGRRQALYDFADTFLSTALDEIRHFARQAGDGVREKRAGMLYRGYLGTSEEDHTQRIEQLLASNFRELVPTM